MQIDICIFRSLHNRGSILDRHRSQSCDICSSPILSSDFHVIDAVLICSTCKIQVHRKCLPLPAPISSTLWRCPPCLNNIRPQRLSCQWCPFYGGFYVRQGSNDKYVHVSCQRWFHDWDKDNRELDAVTSEGGGRGGHAKTAKCERCWNKGDTVKCTANTCKRLFHPACVTHNAQLEEIPSSSPSAASPPPPVLESLSCLWVRGARGRMNRVFCQQHLSEAFAFVSSERRRIFNLGFCLPNAGMRGSFF